MIFTKAKGYVKHCLRSHNSIIIDIYQCQHFQNLFFALQTKGLNFTSLGKIINFFSYVVLGLFKPLLTPPPSPLKMNLRAKVNSTLWKRWLSKRELRYKYVMYGILIVEILKREETFFLKWSNAETIYSTSLPSLDPILLAFPSR